jgi:hypothetical protein
MLLLMVVVVVQEGKVVIRLVSDDLEAVVSMAKAEGNKGRGAVVAVAGGFTARALPGDLTLIFGALLWTGL